MVTGAASGLGLALARALAARGDALMLADIDEPSLQAAAAELRRLPGARIAARRCDVSRSAEVEALREATLAEYGAVHLVFNNAGVAPMGAAWESSEHDWDRALGVNLWGVIHGVRAFMPVLLAQDAGRMVNTASVAGLVSPPGMAAYSATKHAVVALTETLRHDLAARGSKVRCSVVCPAYFPSAIGDAPPPEGETADQRRVRGMLRDAVAAGRLSADEVAARVLAGIAEDRFYILTHPRILATAMQRMEDILEGREPRDPMA